MDSSNTIGSVPRGDRRGMVRLVVEESRVVKVVGKVR
jgi:hypothetical protein